jgi:7-carboxy-7-deazaguanine synthase
VNKLSDFSSDYLPVMEHFYTIQGEGFHAGRPAYFIRLAGCDVGCTWCDVKESWDVDTTQLVLIDELIKTIEETNCAFVVITGGEPTLYNLIALTEKLHEKNIEIAIETSGTNELIGSIDWYCFSPKKFKKPVDQAFELADELKIIINHPSDFAWAEELANQTRKDCLRILQPEWSKQERFLPEIIEFVKKHPSWRISLQTHKIMNIP